jgi:chromosomal replication initiation ATPase DnaA
VLGQTVTETGDDVNKDHTSVLHAIDKINGYYIVGDQQYLVKKIEHLKKLIQDEIKIIESTSTGT